MGGVIVGLDLGEALATVRACGGEPDQDVVTYLSVIEAAVIEATAVKSGEDL